MPRRPIGLVSRRRGAHAASAPAISPLLPITLSVLALLGSTPAPTRAAPLHGRKFSLPAGIGSNLSGMIQAKRAGDQPRFAMLASNGEAVWRGDLLQLQVHLRPGVQPSALTDAALAQLGGRAGVRAIDVMNVWLPLQQVAQLASKHRDLIAFVQLPWRPHSLGAGDAEQAAGAGAGKTVSQGVAKMIDDPDALACTNDLGAGVKVAVIDGSFAKLKASIAAGEVPHLDPKNPTYVTTAGTHGTMCVEVVADVAPGAEIRAISANSYAVLQQFLAEMKMGNPKKIDIVSHSVIWLGLSFGRNSGPACEVTAAAHKQGVAWVNAAGNSGAGKFHAGRWRDQDGDKKHEFKPGDPTLKFRQRWHGGDIKLTLDWDDYAARKVDLNLHLFRENKDGFLEQVATSAKKQGAYTPPVEQIVVQKAPPGVYAVVLTAKTAVPKDMAFRLVNLGWGASTFAIWHKNGNVYDPASCDGVLSVGALHWKRYESGPQEGYSSYGPTPDGRQKPEVMGPSSVATSLGAFGGTSAACPHVAGALALYKAVTSVSAADLIPRLIDDAEPMGPTHPSDPFGYGRVMLRAAGVGWQCDADALGSQPCTTLCGTTGTATCSATCGLSACTPPAEACNGVDDDCDGDVDEGCPALGEDVGSGPDGGAGTTSDATVDGANPGADGLASDGGQPASKSTGEAARSPKNSGCSARVVGARQRSGGAWPYALAVLVGALALWRRRRVAAVSPPCRRGVTVGGSYTGGGPPADGSADIDPRVRSRKAVAFVAAITGDVAGEDALLHPAAHAL